MPSKSKTEDNIQAVFAATVVVDKILEDFLKSLPKEETHPKPKR